MRAAVTRRRLTSGRQEGRALGSARAAPFECRLESARLSFACLAAPRPSARPATCCTRWLFHRRGRRLLGGGAAAASRQARERERER